MIDTVIFDIGMVLVDFCWEKHLLHFGYSDCINREIADAMFLGSEWREYDRSLLPDEEILNKIIRKHPSIEKEIREVFADSYDTIEMYEYAVPWIKELKAKGYKVYLLSNFSRKTYEETKSKMKFLEEVDGGILSFQVHQIKPEPEIYRLLLDKYGITADRAVFLDDSAPNITAAEKQGIYGIHFLSREQAVQELYKLGVR